MRSYNMKEHFNQAWVRLVGACAVTLGSHVFYDFTNGDLPQRIRAHERKHVEQYAKYGVVRFLLRYLFWYLKGRLGGLTHWGAYDKVPFEIEAVKAERGE